MSWKDEQNVGCGQQGERDFEMTRYMRDSQWSRIGMCGCIKVADSVFLLLCSSRTYPKDDLCRVSFNYRSQPRKKRLQAHYFRFRELTYPETSVSKWAYVVKGNCLIRGLKRESAGIAILERASKCKVGHVLMSWLPIQQGITIDNLDKTFHPRTN